MTTPVSANADKTPAVGERRHDSHCPLGRPCRGWETGEHSELWVIAGCRMDRPICESCMNECLCSQIEAIRAEEQGHVRDRIDIAYLEGREAVQREAIEVLTTLLTEYDACKFDYTTPRGGLVEALAVLKAINVNWGTPAAATEPETVTYFHGVHEGDAVEFDWHGVTVRGTVVHPDRNLAGGFLDLDYPDDLNGFVSYDTRQIQNFRILTPEACIANKNYIKASDLPLGSIVRVIEKRYDTYGLTGTVVRVDAYISVQFDGHNVGVYAPWEVVLVSEGSK